MWQWLNSNYQGVTAVGAIMISVIALFVAWDQARVMRAQQHGDVWPALVVDNFQTRDTEQFVVGLQVRNSGVGPAVIESASIYRDGELQDNLSAIHAAYPGRGGAEYTSMVGRIMAPGDEVMPLVVRWDATEDSSSEFQTLMTEWSHWEMTFCYCSVYDQCWMASVLSETRPQRVDRCERQENDVYMTTAATPEEAEQ